MAPSIGGCDPDPTAADGGTSDAGGSDAGAAEDAGPPLDLTEFASLGSSSEGLAFGQLADGSPRLFVTRGLFGDEVLAIDETGAVTVFATVPGGIGIASLSGGGLVVAGRTSLEDGATGALWSVTPAGDASLILDRDPSGAPFMLLNGIVQAPDGRVLFTDSETDRVYRCDVDGGNLEIVHEGIDFANGLAFAPDHTVLYVAEWNAGAIRTMGYDTSTHELGAPGTLATGMMTPDGIAVAASGELIVTSTTDGVHRVSTEGVVERLVPRATLNLPANLAFGVTPFETDRVYISTVAGSAIYSLGL